MNWRIRITFLLIVLIQGLHSVEEYFGKLWEVIPPARLLSSLVSNDLKKGFLIINITLFVFGLWCAFFPVRKGYTFAPGLIWFWVIVEIINGIGHPVWAFRQSAYVPGVASTTSSSPCNLFVLLACAHWFQSPG